MVRVGDGSSALEISTFRCLGSGSAFPFGRRCIPRHADSDHERDNNARRKPPYTHQPALSFAAVRPSASAVRSYNGSMVSDECGPSRFSGESGFGSVVVSVEMAR